MAETTYKPCSDGCGAMIQTYTVAPRCHPCRRANPVLKAPETKRPDHPCDDCGVLMWSSTRYPKGTPGRRCHDCRRLNPKRVHGTGHAYKHGCRCDICKAGNAKRQREYQARRKAKGLPGRWDGVDRSLTRTVYDIICAFCDKPSRTTNPATTTCSASCGLRLINGWSRSLEMVHVPPPGPTCLIPANHPARRPQQAKTWWNVIVSGPCRQCGEQFSARATAGGSAPVYCSTGCANYEGRHTRRARKRNAFVAPVYRRKIFERDGWKCQICRKPVKRDAVVPHPRAPTLDHIIPLAAGGTHEPANSQLACFLCNATKSDGAANDQLRLIG